MVLGNINNIDSQLTTINENQFNQNAPSNYIDRSEDLFAQMNFIALNNKSFLNLR